MAKKRKVYTPEFKLEAIRLLESSKLTMSAVARDLDVAPGRLRAWRREFSESGKSAFPGHGNLTDLEAENRRRSSQRSRIEVRLYHKHLGRFPVTMMCRLLEVSTSGFYAWRSRPASEKEKRSRRLLVKIRAIFECRRRAYGSPRIWRELVAGGEIVGLGLYDYGWTNPPSPM